MTAKAFRIKKGAVVYSQGSGTTILDVQGDSGQMFSVVDNLIGLIHHVSDASGTPIFEVYSDNILKLGTYGSPGLIVNGSNVELPHISAATSPTAYLALEGGVVKSVSASDIVTGGGGVSGTISAGQVAFGTGVNTIGGDSGLIWDNTNKRLGVNRTPTGIFDVNFLSSSDQVGFYNATTRRFLFSGSGVFWWGQNTDSGNNRGQLSWDTNIAFVNTPSGTDYAIRTSSSNRLFVTSAGLIGIATISPTNTLDVNGTGRIRNGVTLADTSGNVLIGTTTDSGYKLNVNGQAYLSSGLVTNTAVPIKLIVSGGTLNDSSEIRTGSGEFKIFSGRFNAAHQSIAFATGDNYTSGATRMFINPTGNVGINTISPSRRLHVAGDGILVDNGTGTAVIDLYSTTDFRLQATTDFELYDVTSAATRLKVTSTGNVGIGTSSPVANTHIHSATTDTALQLTNSTTGVALSDGFRIALTSSNVSLLLRENAVMSFGTNNTERMRITPEGNLLIGTTTNPGQKLYVEGNVLISSDAAIYGSITGAGHQNGVVTTAQRQIGGFFLSSSPESATMVAHPYLMSDLAYFTSKGGTVTVTGLSTTFSSDVLFRADANFISVPLSSYTGSTFTLELSNINTAVTSLLYGAYFGITFGNIGWAPASMKIEWSVDNGVNWTTALDSSVKNAYYYTKLANSNLAITNIRLTIGQPASSLRICNIFATDYNGEGIHQWYLPREGGLIYGNITAPAFVKTGGTSAQFLKADGSVDSTTYATASAISGTINYIPKFTASGTIGNSQIFDNGTTVGIGTTTAYSKLHVVTSGTSGITSSPNRGIIITDSIGGRITLEDTGASSGSKNYVLRSEDGRFSIGALNDSGTAWTSENILNIISSGNVLIGTTTDSGGKLQVSGNGKFIGSSSQTLDIGTSTGVSYIQSYGSALAATPLLFYTGTTERMRIASDGNVGVGTISPTIFFHIRKDSIYSSENTTSLGIDSGGANGSAKLLIGVDTTNDLSYIQSMQQFTGWNKKLVLQGMGGNVLIGTITDSGQKLQVSGDAYVSGNVGIGTSAPIEKLQVVGNINASRILATNNTNIAYSAGAGNTTGQIYLNSIRGNRTLEIKTEQISLGDTIDGISFNSFYTNTAAPVDMIFKHGTVQSLFLKGSDSSGNVGIGTTNPLGKVHISGGTGSAVLILQADVNNTVEASNPKIWFKQDGDYNEAAIQLNASNELNIISNVDGGGGIVFRTGQTDNTGSTDPINGAIERMRITPTGNVLIGTSTDGGKKLSVVGEFMVTNWVSSAGAYDAISVNFGEDRGLGYDPTSNEIFAKGLTTVPVKIDTDAPTDSFNILSTGGIKMANIPSGTPATALGLDSNNELVKSTAVSSSSGTFSPKMVTLNNYEFTYTSRVANYIKIGSIVFFEIVFTGVEEPATSDNGFGIIDFPFSVNGYISAELSGFSGSSLSASDVSALYVGTRATTGIELRVKTTTSNIGSAVTFTSGYVSINGFYKTNS